jgi:hypothetical protein
LPASATGREPYRHVFDLLKIRIAKQPFGGLFIMRQSLNLLTLHHGWDHEKRRCD